MTEFQFPCPHCGAKIACEVGYTGWQINCPRCQQPLIIPAPGTVTSSAGNFSAGQASRSAPGVMPMGTGQSSPRCGLAVAALFLSVLGLPGIICGHMAVSRLRKNPQLTGGPFALAGLVIGYVVLALTVTAIVVPQFRKGHSNSASDQTINTPVTTTASSTTSKPSGKVPDSSYDSPRLVWQDDFESGLQKWKAVPQASDLALSKTQDHTSGNGQSAKVSSSLNKMYRDIAADLQIHARISFWLYEGEQDRAFGEVRSYSGGIVKSDNLSQIFAIGRYTIRFATNATGILAGKTVDITRYQGRIMSGANAGWFNLDDPGAPSRSPGWHHFEIEREKDGTTIKFFVDGTLGKTVPGAARSKWTTITIGSVGADKVAGDCWFDDVKIESFVPETNVAANVEKSPKPTKSKPGKKK